MANALNEKTLTICTIILHNEEVARDFMENASGHFEFMQTKSFQDGSSQTSSVCRLIRHRVEGIQLVQGWEDTRKKQVPEKTGSVVVTLFEIYETEDGLHQHWIESKDIHLLAENWLKEVGGEISVHTHQTIMQSLWD